MYLYHYDVLSSVLIRVGPLVRHWTMRYEAKHQYFKQLARSMGNYINICHSLAIRHQSLQCYLLQSGAVLHHNQADIGNGTQIANCTGSSSIANY